MGLEHCRQLDAYDAVLATPQLLARHGDAPFWRTLKAEAIPLLAGDRFPWAGKAHAAGPGCATPMPLAMCGPQPDGT